MPLSRAVRHCMADAPRGRPLTTRCSRSVRSSTGRMGSRRGSATASTLYRHALASRPRAQPPLEAQVSSSPSLGPPRMLVLGPPCPPPLLLVMPLVLPLVVLPLVVDPPPVPPLMPLAAASGP